MDAGKRRGRSRTRSKRKKRTFRRRKGGPAPRPYKTDKKSRAKRRFTRPRHKKSTVHGHHKRRLQEAQLTNDLLTMMLKAQKPGAMPRHHSNDPEYAFSSPRMQEFKRLRRSRHQLLEAAGTRDAPAPRELSRVEAGVGAHLPAPSRRVNENH